MPYIMTKEQALERLKRNRAESLEVAQFAQQRDKLALFKAAEIDLAMYDVVIEVMERVVTEEKTKVPR